jgi:hypothetical protein
MNTGIEGNSYGAVISPSRLTYKIGQGSAQVMRDAVLIGTNDDEVNYGSTQSATDLILQMPMMYNNGIYIGSGALSLQVPDGTAKGGNARGNGAVDLQTYRNNASQVASGTYSVAMGYNNASSSSYAAAFGNNNTSSGNASVAIGYQNISSNSYSIAMGGNNTASNGVSVAIGSNNTSTGFYSTAIGYYCVASGDCSIALSSQSVTNNISSKVAIGTAINYSIGVSQYGQLGVGAITTDATATVLKSDINALSARNQCTLQNNNAMSFTIEVVARNISTGMTGRWEAKGLIKRGANASSTALVGTPTVTLTNSDNEAWIVAGAIAITADTTYGALAVTVTGAASTTIHWMCRINTVEII